MEMEVKTAAHETLLKLNRLLLNTKLLVEPSGGGHPHPTVYSNSIIEDEGMSQAEKPGGMRSIHKHRELIS